MHHWKQEQAVQATHSVELYLSINSCWKTSTAVRISHPTFLSSKDCSLENICVSTKNFCRFCSLSCDTDTFTATRLSRNARDYCRYNLQKVANHLGKNHENSTLATFRTNYHVSALHLPSSQKFVKNPEKSSIWPKLATFRSSVLLCLIQL